MRINFKKLEIRNFMSFEDEIFEFNQHHGLNLICGKNIDIPGSKNGAGKSTIFNALCYGLFGETPNKIKNENIRNKYTNEKDVRVVVYFDVEDISYKIASGLNRNSSFCNIYLINSDGSEDDLTKSSIAETHKFIENEILHFDMSIFLRTIMLTSDNQYNFFRLKKQDKKEFIEKLFDISIFGDIFNLIHKDILSIDKKVLAIQNRLIVLNKSDEDYQNHIEKYNLEQTKQIETLNNELTIIQQEKIKLSSQLTTVNSDEIEKLELASSKISKEIRKLEDSIRTIDNNIAKNKLSISNNNDQIQLRQKLIDKHSGILNKLCDDCKIIFSEYYNLTNIQTEIEKLNNNSEKIKQTIFDCSNKKLEIKEKIKKYNDKINKISDKIFNLTNDYRVLTNKIAAIDSQILVLTNKITSIENQVNPYIKLYNDNKVLIEKETSELNIIKEKYGYLKFAEHIVSQDTLKKFIIKDLIHLLNNKITFYLNKLGSNYSCVFDENMDYIFKTNGGTCEYDSFSSGERMRLNIAVSFAFRDFMATRSNIVSNILILDEYIDSNIDALAIEGIINILKEYIMIYNQNIFVISHRKEIDNSIFTNIIQVQKQNNVSKIKYLT